MMPGMIMGWPWSIATIPSGWHLCDGTMGTPDYRNYYLVCAGDLYTPEQVVGANSHDHTIQGDGHSHNLLGGNVVEDKSPAGDFAYGTNISAVTGDTNAVDNRPLSKAINWIMKL